MKLYGLNIDSVRGLTNLDLIEYAHRLGIKHFWGVFMRDTLPKKPRHQECGIVNSNTSQQPGSHWVCYYKDGDRRIYLESFGQITPKELQKYLKTKKERGVGVIQRNTDIVQRINTYVCGDMCLFVLMALTRRHLSYQEVHNKLKDGYTQGDW